MIKQMRYSDPEMFPMIGTSLADAIIDILSKEPGLKARLIAYRLNKYFGFIVVRKDVNSLLFGKLRNQVKQSADYKWTLRKIAHPIVKPAVVKPITAQLANPTSVLVSYHFIPQEKKVEEIGFWRLLISFLK